MGSPSVVRAARAEEEGDYLSLHVYREAARQLEQLAATEVALASLHMELAEKEHNRVKENKYLLEQLAAAQAENKQLQAIVDRLRAAELGQTAWEDDEDVVTLNGKPVGGTVSRNRNPEFHRWWPAAKRELLGEAAETAEGD